MGSICLTAYEKTAQTTSSNSYEQGEVDGGILALASFALGGLWVSARRRIKTKLNK
jgi:hypothetical protein